MSGKQTKSSEIYEGTWRYEKIENKGQQTSVHIPTLKEGGWMQLVADHEACFREHYVGRLLVLEGGNDWAPGSNLHARMP